MDIKKEYRGDYISESQVSRWTMDSGRYSRVVKGGFLLIWSFVQIMAQCAVLLKQNFIFASSQLGDIIDKD